MQGVISLLLNSIRRTRKYIRRFWKTGIFRKKVIHKKIPESHGKIWIQNSRKPWKNLEIGFTS